MESRFSVKDAILFVLVGMLIVLVILAMLQFDRQWERVREISHKVDKQWTELREVREALAKGVVAVNPTTQQATTGNGSASAVVDKCRKGDGCPPYSGLSHHDLSKSILFAEVRRTPQSVRE